MLLIAVVFTLAGISVGSAVTGLRGSLGDPLLVEETSKVSRTADFLRPEDPSAVLRVTERDGVVFAVEIGRERAEPAAGFHDSYGVALGMDRAAVVAKRGKPAFASVNTWLYPENANEDASYIYRFDGEIVEAIKLVGSGSTAAGDATLPRLAEAMGDDYANAILDMSPTVLASDHFRDRYLTVHGCDSSGRVSTNERRDRRTYAVTTATCAAGKRVWYFDVSRSRS